MLNYGGSPEDDKKLKEQINPSCGVTSLNFDELLKRMQASNQCILIISGRNGEHIVPDLVKNYVPNHGNLKAIFIHCLDRDKHQKWVDVIK